MLRLHTARFLARLVLAWFGLYLGAAAAAPMWTPAPLLGAICSAADLAATGHGHDDGSGTHASLHCPLCAPATAPPPPAAPIIVAPAQPLAYALRSIPAARIAALTAAPLPARGPPFDG